MSETQFELDDEDYKDGYVLVFDSITNDSTISDAAYRLLVHLHSNSDTWKVYGRFTAHLLGWGKDKMTRAIRELYNLGFITRTQFRNNGEWAHFIYKVSFKKKFKNPVWQIPNSRKKSTKKERVFHESLPVQASQPERENPAPVNPGPGIQPLPMPNKPMPNKPKAMEAMPSHSRNQKAMAPSVTKGRRFKRPQEEEDRFQWLLGLTLLDEHGKVNEDALSFMAHSYSQEKLQRTYFHLVHKLDKKKVQVKKSPLAFYRHLLENEHNCRASHAELNESMAKKFSSELAWGSLEFHEKYVIDRNIPSKDIDFNLEPEVFKDLLSQLYFNVYGNFGT